MICAMTRQHHKKGDSLSSTQRLLLSIAQVASDADATSPHAKRRLRRCCSVLHECFSLERVLQLYGMLLLLLSC